MGDARRQKDKKHDVVGDGRADRNKSGSTCQDAKDKQEKGAMASSDQIARVDLIES